MQKSLLCFIAICVLFANFSYADQRISKEYGYTINKLPKIRLVNETNESLFCYIAIDGFKKKFILTPRAKSKWYKATDKGFNFSSFSVKCDYQSNRKE